MPRQLLYATNNPGKVMEIRAILDAFGLEILAPSEIGLALDVPETGTTLEENARLKAAGYSAHLSQNGDAGQYVILADDTGLEIDALGGEPGIHIRRWDGSERMSDAAIIATVLARLEGVPLEQRGAQFRTVIAVGLPGQPVTLFDGTLRGIIRQQPGDLQIEGFPFEALFEVPEWGLLLGEIHALPREQRMSYLTHRQRAIRKALPHLRDLLAQ